MTKRSYTTTVIALATIASMALIGCGKESDQAAAPEQAAPEQVAVEQAKSVTAVQTTPVTEENYARAETEVIFAD